MATESEKQAEKERVTRISGFRVGFHDFLAEVDLEALCVPKTCRNHKPVGERLCHYAARRS